MSFSSLTVALAQADTTEPAASLRASDAERDAVLELLAAMSVEGRLSLAEQEDRQHAAQQAVTIAQLRALLADLPVQIDDPQLRPLEVEPIELAGQVEVATARRSPWHVVQVLGMLGVMAALMVFAGSQMSDAVDNSHDERAKVSLRNAHVAAMHSFSDHGRYAGEQVTAREIFLNEATLRTSARRKIAEDDVVHVIRARGTDLELKLRSRSGRTFTLTAGADGERRVVSSGT